jgi:hypothetical protein
VGRRRKHGPRDPQCAVAEWTEWSPCSVTCNQGYKIRTRVYTMPFVPNRICDNIRLTQKQDCRLAVCWNSDYYDGHDDSGLRAESEYRGGGGPGLTLTIVEQPRQGFCLLEPTPGICKSSREQWFYNSTEGSCARFMYTGCGGNRNNFNTEAACITACQPNPQGRGRFRGLQSQSLTREDFLQNVQDDQPPSPEDCLVSDWAPWSLCSASCGNRGWVTRDRVVLAQARHGGKACPRKLRKRKRCSQEVPCPANPPQWYQSNWRMLEDTNGSLDD